VDEHRRVATVVEDHVRAGRVPVGVLPPGEDLVGAPPVVLKRLALPGEDRHALRVLRGAGRTDDDGRGRLVLGGEDVARGPAHLRAERDEGLDEHGGLDGHVQRSGDAGARQRLAIPVLRAQRHEAGHLVLGQPQLVPTRGSEVQVGDLEIGEGHSRAPWDLTWADPASPFRASVCRVLASRGRSQRTGT
jgi:hypothetical protein